MLTRHIRGFLQVTPGPFPVFFWVGPGDEASLTPGLGRETREKLHKCFAAAITQKALTRNCTVFEVHEYRMYKVVLSVLLAELHSFAYTGQACVCMCIDCIINESIEERLELSIL